MLFETLLIKWISLAHVRKFLNFFRQEEYKIVNFKIKYCSVKNCDNLQKIIHSVDHFNNDEIFFTLRFMRIVEYK